MARDFVKRNAVRKDTGFSKQLLLILVSFLMGYLSASIADLPTLTSWIKTQLIAHNTTLPVTKPLASQAQLPKPKFEFYTMLADENKAAVEPVATVAKTTTAPSTAVVSAPAPVGVPKTVAAMPTRNKNTLSPSAPPPAAVVTAKPISPPARGGKDSYLVQVAAFKSRQEAEKMKAAMGLKGFLVNIAVVKQQNTNWFRVCLGPFPSKPEAQKAQGAVAESEHIIGMIRKMDA